MGEVPGRDAIDDPGAHSKALLRVIDGRTYQDWETVYRDNVLGIYHLVFRRVGNAPEAEDRCEEVLLRALPRLRLPAPVHEVRAYLVKTARTVLVEHWRKHYAPRESEMHWDMTDVPNDAAIGSPLGESAAAVRASRILGLLPDRFRQILELRFLRGYSVAEAAREMGVSDSNAKVLQYRALRKAAELAGDLEP